MQHYELVAVKAGAHPIDTVEARDDEEAIALTILRLERADIEIRREGSTVAALSSGGRIIRMAPSAVST